MQPSLLISEPMTKPSSSSSTTTTTTTTNVLPYYAVIFSSKLTGTDIMEGYTEMANEIEELAKQQDGFIGIESSSRDSSTTNFFGITISYWKDLKSISKWKSNAKHIVAQKLGQKVWYQSYQLRIAKVEREYGFDKEEEEEEEEEDEKGGR